MEFAIVTDVELSDRMSVPLMPKTEVEGLPPGAVIEKNVDGLTVRLMRKSVFADAPPISSTAAGLTVKMPTFPVPLGVRITLVLPLPPASVRLVEAGEVREGVVTLVRNAGAAAFILRVPLVVPSTAMKSPDAVVVAVVARSLIRLFAIKLKLRMQAEQK